MIIQLQFDENFQAFLPFLQIVRLFAFVLIFARLRDLYGKIPLCSKKASFEKAHNLVSW